MSRKRGRPARQYCLQVRTVRREPLDYAALARAALEHAALTQHQGETALATERDVSRRPTHSDEDVEVDDDRVA